MSRSYKHTPKAIIAGCRPKYRAEFKKMHNRRVRRMNHIRPLYIDPVEYNEDDYDNIQDSLPSGNFYRKLNCRWDYEDLYDIESFDEFLRNRLNCDNDPTLKSIAHYCSEYGDYDMKYHEKPYVYGDHLDQVRKDYIKFYLSKQEVK